MSLTCGYENFDLADLQQRLHARSLPAASLRMGV
jgi:hypothetical protein